ncbi:DUF6113 family protein [Nocardioides sp.]|uniref:DUF6113 family protein n=1 Tax=Nocardioides sp. TaxID=35761 RepID=UPI0035174310
MSPTGSEAAPVRRPRVARIVGGLALAVLGVAVGVSSVAVHALAWGLPLGIATVAAVLVALPAGLSGRFAFAVGWVGVLVVAMVRRPEGDFLIASDLLGYLLLAQGLVVLAVGTAGVVPRRGARSRGEGVEPDAARGSGDAGDVGGVT